MKMMQIQYIALFLVGSFSLAAASKGMRGAAASSQLQHPPPAFPIKAAAGPAAAKKTALPTLDSTTVTWKVKKPELLRSDQGVEGPIRWWRQEDDRC